jgi:hypothetical protein
MLLEGEKGKSSVVYDVKLGLEVERVIGVHEGGEGGGINTLDPVS